MIAVDKAYVGYLDGRQGFAVALFIIQLDLMRTYGVLTLWWAVVCIGRPFHCIYASHLSKKFNVIKGQVW